MNFVTKKEFEDAVKVLERALHNEQVVHGVDHALTFTSLLFGNGNEEYKAEQASFVPPLQAAKNRLFAVNNTIKKQKEETDKNQRSLEKLELQAQSLYAIIPTLKE